MEKLEKKLVKILEKESGKFRDDPDVIKFIKADKEFSELVEKGLAQRRGNNQLPADQINLKTQTFNTIQS